MLKFRYDFVVVVDVVDVVCYVFKVDSTHDWPHTADQFC